MRTNPYEAPHAAGQPQPAIQSRDWVDAAALGLITLGMGPAFAGVIWITCSPEDLEVFYEVVAPTVVGICVILAPIVFVAKVVDAYRSTRTTGNHVIAHENPSDTN